jgi:hypothetical protein
VDGGEHRRGRARAEVDSDARGFGRSHAGLVGIMLGVGAAKSRRGQSSCVDGRPTTSATHVCLHGHEVR